MDSNIKILIILTFRVHARGKLVLNFFEICKFPVHVNKICIFKKSPFVVFIFFFPSQYSIIREKMAHKSEFSLVLHALSLIPIKSVIVF